MTPTWYDLLGVDPTADPDEIRAAWRAAIADLDPTERRFATLNEAAAVLLDPARRSAYDAELAASQPEPEPVETAPAPEVEPVETAPAPEVEPVETEPVATEVSTSSTSEASTSEASTSEGSTSRAPYLVPGWVLATLGVVTAAAVVLAVVLGSHASADKIVQTDVQLASGSTVSDIEEPAMAAQAAAKEAVVRVVSYDYRHLDADKKAAESVMTDSYRSSYDKLFDQLRPSIVSTQTVITAKVVETGIVRASGDRVEVLVFVDRSTTKKSSAAPMPTQDQVTLTMRKVGGTWLVDNLRTNQIPE